MSKELKERPARTERMEQARSAHELTMAEALARDIFVHAASEDWHGMTAHYLAGRAFEAADAFNSVLAQRRENKTEPKRD